MFEPLPLEEHWTIIPLPSQRATCPLGPSSTPKKIRSAGWYPPAGGSAAAPRLTRPLLCELAPAGRRPFAVHCTEVVVPMSTPACANAQRANMEQSHVEPAGSRLCMSCTEPPRSVGGPRLYVKRPTCATAQARTMRASPDAPGAKAPRYSV